MDPREILRPVKGGVELNILLSPGSQRAGIERVDPWRKRLVIRVSSAPEKGKANKELCDILSGLFSREVTLTHGVTSREKSVFIPMEMEEAASLLERVI